METVMKVRRWVLIDGLSRRDVSRRTGLSRNTIAKYLADDRPPEYRRHKEAGSRRLFEYEVMLRGFYEGDLALPRRERRTIRGLYEALVCEGYQGSYDTVCRYIKRLKPQSGKGNAAFIPLAFDPFDAMQFDWSHEIVNFGGVDSKVYVAHFRLCHSRKPFIVAYPRESQEMVLDAFNRALAFYGGVPRRVIIDNATTMVTRIGKGRERDYHPRFLARMFHYVLEPEACNAAAGWGEPSWRHRFKPDGERAG